MVAQGSEDHQDGWVGAERGGEWRPPSVEGRPLAARRNVEGDVIPAGRAPGLPGMGYPAYHISHEATARSEIPGTPVGGVQTTGESRPLYHRDHATVPLCADA